MALNGVGRLPVVRAPGFALELSPFIENEQWETALSYRGMG
jgi:hypothetical protein